MMWPSILKMCTLLHVFATVLFFSIIVKSHEMRSDDGAIREEPIGSNGGYPVDDVGTNTEGVVQAYIFARELVEEELEAASPDGELDLDTEAMAQLRAFRSQLESLGLSTDTLANLLDGDPLLNLPKRGDNGLTITKRTIEKNKLRRWTKNIVPYLLTNDTNEFDRKEIYRAMKVFERYTCIRFYPWEDINQTTTNDRLQLDHQSYLRFVKEGRCFSFVGNLRKKRGIGGQVISCCGQTTCIHELGHAMGAHHEHTSPNPDRTRFIRINWHKIKPEKVFAYTLKSPKFVSESGYDMSSYMHYHPFYDKFTKLYPELPTSGSHHYMLKEISFAHRCHDCSNSELVCENDGYLSIVDGKCACECIPGFDPSTRCTTIMKDDPPGLSFPGGQYALPAPASGCPADTFRTGSSIQYNNGGNKKSDNYHLFGDVTSNKVEHTFCVALEPANNYTWPSGNYCIYRKGGTCPDGFTEGFVHYNNGPVGSKTYPNSQSGEIPDGVFGEDSRFQYCCNYGFTRDSLVLPSRQPLVLIKRRKQQCQKVKSMHVYESTLKLANFDKGETELQGGDHPVAHVSKGNVFSTVYCQYVPAFINCGDIIELNYSNTEVTVSSPSKPELECYWLIKAPLGERLQLDFSEFNIKGRPDRCIDELEVRYVRMGQPGLTYCGPKWDKTTLSLNNTLHLRFSTRGNSTSHFTAKIKLVKNQDLCYATSDRGMTYDGDVNFTRDFEPCLPWHQVTHCEMHSFKSDAFVATLQGNECRNPDQTTGFMPWCYTKAKGCRRNYCDVCQQGNKFDMAGNCEELKAKGKCNRNLCAKTCASHYSWPETPMSVKHVNCSAPGNITDGFVVDDEKSYYSPGESVLYKCNYAVSTRRRYCLTSGQWSALGSVCRACPDGFNHEPEFGKCYLYSNKSVNNADARSFCQRQGGSSLVVPESEEENNLIRNYTGSQIWLGINDAEEEEKWVTFNGQQISFTNWANRQPDNWKAKEHCAVMYESTTAWNDVSCNGKRNRVICQKQMTHVRDCLDRSDNCSKILNLTPTMCTEFSEFAAEYCSRTCRFCE